jgi:hypothetical protein
MSRWRIDAIVLLIIAIAPARGADEPAGSVTRDDRQQRLAFMRRTLADFTFQIDGDPPLPLTLPDAPVLAYTNPVRSREGSGATYFLAREGRPLAAATISIRPQGKVVREFTLLGDEPIVARRKGELEWTPRNNGVSFAPLEGANDPVESAALRLAQMRRLAQRFRLRVLRENALEARLLTQPLLRYTNPHATSRDGAVFAFVEATDPEVFLLLEVRADEAHPKGRWQFSLARMTSQPIEVYLDDRRIWAVPGYYRAPRSRDDSYRESLEGLYSSEGKMIHRSVRLWIVSL